MLYALRFFSVYLETSYFELIMLGLIIIFAVSFFGCIIGGYVGFVLSFVTRKYFQNPEHNENLYRWAIITIGMIASLLPSIFLGSAVTWEVTTKRPLSYEVLIIVIIGYLIVMARVSYVSGSYHLEYQRNNPKKGAEV